jgi:hypothetical protein
MRFYTLMYKITLQLEIFCLYLYNYENDLYIKIFSFSLMKSLTNDDLKY